MNAHEALDKYIATLAVERRARVARDEAGRLLQACMTEVDKARLDFEAALVPAVDAACFSEPTT